MRNRIAVLLVVTGTIAACASEPPLSDLERAEALGPLVCQTKGQCDLYMQRAMAWIAQNSTWRIQIANDTLVQTFGPGNHEVTLAYRVIREGRPDGSAELRVIAACDNLFGCQPRPVVGMLLLKRYITAR